MKVAMGNGGFIPMPWKRLRIPSEQPRLPQLPQFVSGCWPFSWHLASTGSYYLNKYSLQFLHPPVSPSSSVSILQCPLTPSFSFLSSIGRWIQSWWIFHWRQLIFFFFFFLFPNSILKVTPSHPHLTSPPNAARVALNISWSYPDDLHKAEDPKNEDKMFLEKKGEGGKWEEKKNLKNTKNHMDPPSHLPSSILVILLDIFH